MRGWSSLEAMLYVETADAALGMPYARLAKAISTRRGDGSTPPSVQLGLNSADTEELRTAAEFATSLYLDARQAILTAIGSER
jgi:hypothetical protein